MVLQEKKWKNTCWSTLRCFLTHEAKAGLAEASTSGLSAPGQMACRPSEVGLPARGAAQETALCHVGISKDMIKNGKTHTASELHGRSSSMMCSNSFQKASKICGKESGYRCLFTAANTTSPKTNINKSIHHVLICLHYISHDLEPASIHLKHLLSRFFLPRHCPTDCRFSCKARWQHPGPSAQKMEQ